jgi:hypothetical protein
LALVAAREAWATILVGEARRGSIEQLPDALARRGKLIGHGSIRKKNFVQAEGGKLIETFLNCEIEVTPERRKRADDTVRQHDDERMAAGPRFQPHIDGARLKMHGLTLAVRVATIFDGLALAMIDGEVGLGGEADGVSGFRFPSRV